MVEKKEKQLISVIIPAFNAEAHLRQSVESVIAQDYRPIEILVVDDGSTDRTRAIAETLGGVVTCLTKTNGGASAARNFGIEHARGELLSFLDADDLWVPGKLALQLKVLEDDPALEAVFGHVQQMYELDEKNADPVFGEILPGYVPGTMLIRCDAMQRVGYFDTKWRLAEVVDWYIQAREHNLKELLLPEVLLNRRIHGENSGILKKQHQTEYLRIIKAELDRKRARESKA